MAQNSFIVFKICILRFNFLYSVPLQNLIEYFLKFPGIGPKQATRFAFFLLNEKDEYRKNLSNAIAKLGKTVGICEQCYKSIHNDTNIRMNANNTNKFCEYCRDKKRDASIIMVVEKETDMENVEKTKQYNGLYHILNGTISPLEPSSPEKLRLKELFNRVKTIVTSGKNCEIILATNATTEGDTTALYIQRVLEPLSEKINPIKNQPPETITDPQTDWISHEVKITRLGRGLTTGSELEYSDPATIANALTNRR